MKQACTVIFYILYLHRTMELIIKEIYSHLMEKRKCFLYFCTAEALDWITAGLLKSTNLTQIVFSLFLNIIRFAIKNIIKSKYKTCLPYKISKILSFAPWATKTYQGFALGWLHCWSKSGPITTCTYILPTTSAPQISISCSTPWMLYMYPPINSL